MAFYQFTRKQWIPVDLDTLWDFMATPKNLGKITPRYMGFNIISENPADKMYPGMIIGYKVRPLLHIPMTWVTEITHIKEKEFFIDEQRIGPYAFWHHQHQFEISGKGVMMTDIVTYKPPFGFLGIIANKLLIRKRLESIFAFREKVLKERFSG